MNKYFLYIKSKIKKILSLPEVDANEILDDGIYFRKCNFCGCKEFKIFKKIDKNFPIKIYGDKEITYPSSVHNLKLQYVECSSCGLIFINPLIKFSDINQNSFDGECNIVAWKDIDYLDYSNEKTEIIKGFYDYFNFEEYKKNNRILDVSCGPAVSLNWLKKHKGWDIHGIDPDRYSVKVAKEKYNIDINNGLIHDLKDPDGSFDFILMDNSLEHMFNPLSTLIKSFNLIRKGGAVLIIVPNANGLSTNFFDANCDWGHWFFYTPKSLFLILEQIGFKTVQLLSKQEINQALLDKGIDEANYKESLNIELNDDKDINRIPETGIFGDYFAILVEKPLDVPDMSDCHKKLISIAQSSTVELNSKEVIITA